MLKKFFILIFILFIDFIYSQESKNAVEKIYSLSEIVVSATKTETEIAEIGNVVTLITSEQIENSKKIFVLDLLKEIPSVSVVQQGGSGKLATVFIRGGNAYHTLVLIDGIAVNNPADASNIFDFSNLSTTNIERIEILRGPQSNLYGSNAVSGIISIFTKKGNSSQKGNDKNIFYNLNLEGGSYSTFKGNFNFSGLINNFYYSLDLAKYKTDGFSSANEIFGNNEKDGYVSDNYNAKFGYDFSDNLKIDFNFIFTTAKADFDQFGGSKGDDPNYYYELEETIFNSKLNSIFFNGNLNQTFSVSLIRNFRKYFDEVDKYSSSSSFGLYDGKRVKLDFQNSYKINSNNLILLGIETEEEQAVSDYYSNSLFGVFNSFFPQTRIRSSGMYLQNQFKYNNNYFLTAGFRFDKNEKFGSIFTYRVSSAYLLFETATKLRASFGTGFKAPSLFYLYDPGYGNSDLKPETSNGWDVGFDQFLLNEKLTLSVSYFKNSFNDLFGFDSNFKAINIAKAITNGYEIDMSLKLIQQLKIDLSYSSITSIDKSENSPEKDLPLLRRPKNKMAINFSYNPNDIVNINAQIISVDKREDKDYSAFPARRITLEQYTLVNLTLNMKLNNNLEFFTRIENLLDKEYEDVFGYGTPKFSLYLGTKFGF